MKKILLVVILILTVGLISCSSSTGGKNNLPDVTISIPAILGVAMPVVQATPVTTITATSQFTGTITWEPNHPTFEAETVYTATITLTAKDGFTLQDVAANFFKLIGVVGATATNSANSGIITAEFQAIPTFTVDFNSNDGSEIDSISNILRGETINKPADPTKGIWTFEGWYKDDDVEWNFNEDTVTDNITLFAKWKLLEMVRLDGGTFTMGNNEIWNREHQVTVDGFYMGIYQVTQEQYLEVMTGNPNGIDASPSEFNGEPGGNLDRTPAEGEIQEKRPVDSILWLEAIVFCNRLSVMEGLIPAYGMQSEHIWTPNPDMWGAMPTTTLGNIFENINRFDRWSNVKLVENSNGYRLPTEAEWEYACKAGTTTLYNTGDTISNDTGWYDANSNPTQEQVGRRTRQVGLKPANAWGLFDMHGNINEWCWNRGYDYGTEPITNPMGPLPFQYNNEYRMRRGGSYTSGAVQLPSAFRSSANILTRAMSNGFRVIRPLD